MTDKYAVIGHPISHSKSPFIQNRFALQTCQDMEYTAIEVPLDEFESSLQQLRDVLKLKGVNVTVPFKEQAWQLISNLSARAQRAGAVNTIVFNDDGSCFGDNTDGIGLCRDLTLNHQIPLNNKKVLLLGAGGAARGVIEPLLSYRPQQLFIANRTAEKARQLAQQNADLGPVIGSGFDDITGGFDVIINATAASLNGDVPPLPADVLNAHASCYDMMYGDSDTAFISWAKQHGAAKTLNGLGMLIEQAAEAFYLWRDIRPDTHALIDYFQS